ncbi:MAG TPA: response regulator [Longimicrobium sp.]|nr:response regulator [Longimicrobium sp.]
METRRTVLVVEDDEDHRAITTMALEHAGFRVVSAVNGAAGVDEVVRERPDLVLMDASLPQMDGWTATVKIKEHAPDLCVLIVSAHAMPQHREMAAAAGCDGYYTKPILPAELIRIVRDCIDRQGP